MCQICEKDFCKCREKLLQNISLYKHILTPMQIKYYSNLNIKPQKTFDNDLIRHNILLKEKSFILEHDGTKNVHMTNLIFKDMIMLDWDEKDGISKDKAIELLKIFTEKGKIKLKNLCFKIYESDNGVHAFLVSHKIFHKNELANFLKLSLCTDIFYNIFTYNNGTNIRLTPKITESDILKTENPIKTQFIQKEGINFKGQNVKYLGNVKNIDSDLEKLTNLVFQTQLFVLKQENLINKLLNNDPELLENIKKFILNYN